MAAAANLCAASKINLTTNEGQNGKNEPLASKQASSQSNVGVALGNPGAGSS
jgi:hypothetical protein